MECPFQSIQESVSTTALLNIKCSYELTLSLQVYEHHGPMGTNGFISFPQWHDEGQLLHERLSAWCGHSMVQYS